MTRLCSEKTSLILLGFLALAAAGCPRTDFDFGGDGIAGKGSGGAGAAGSDDAAGSGTAGSTSSGESCGSRGLPACSDDEFCSFPSSASCGETDKPGVCKPKTKGDVICTLEYAPVCGCDGKTYGNACGAAAANTSVRKAGECEGAVGGRSCGGLIGKGCPDNQYCDYPPDAICGAADATGTCMAKPRACTRIYKPVCGCDDKTYGNDCEAHAAGVSIASEGECKSNGGQSCGGLIGKPCADDQYCEYKPEALCGAADATGTCVPRPEVCADIYKPVCGCDGKKYGNACEAAVAGMSIVSEGECKPSGGDGKSCGGLLGQSCPDGQYCDYPPDAICGAADATGVCKVKPTACTFEYAPVCGCDGETYPTACAAASSGVSVASKGECEDPSGGANCGGIAGLQCEGKNQYCNFPVATRCGSGDQFGQCADKPTGCTKELHEVCGCDGNTYGNPCMAAAAGVSIQKDGACAQVGGSGKTCGGLIGAQCPSGEYCDYPESAQCGAADQTGTCKTIPEVCTADYTPVCGCDDKTYGNACGANAKSVSVLHGGPC